MVLLNTCHIREKAAEKVYSDIGRLKPLRAAKPDLRIAVAGCVAQAEGEEILARAPMVDMVVGPQSYQNLPALLARAEAGEESGAWIAAQVRASGGRITIARAFDSLPPWYAGKGPTLRALTWEMQQRSAAWRPTWATLLPG